MKTCEKNKAVLLVLHVVKSVDIPQGKLTKKIKGAIHGVEKKIMIPCLKIFPVLHRTTKIIIRYLGD